MTKKEKLRLMALPLDPPPRLGIPDETAEEIKTGSRWTCLRKTRHYFCAAREMEGVLILTAWNKGELVFRTFQKGREFFAQRPGMENPSSSTIESLWDWNVVYHLSPEGEGAVLAHLDRTDKSWATYNPNRAEPFRLLRDWQRKIRKDAVEERNNRIRREINDRMLEIRPLPKDVIRWIGQGPMAHARYLFYRYQKGKATAAGWCTACGKTVEVKGARHREKGRCPHCRREITYLASGRCGKWVFDDGWFCYLQKTSAGWCYRTFHVWVRQAPQPWGKPVPWQISEEERAFYSLEEDRITERYGWGNFRQTGRMAWCPGPGERPERMWIYPGNLNTRGIIPDREPWRYMPWADLARRASPLRPEMMMLEPRRRPWMEYLCKMGLWKLAAAVINGEHLHQAIFQDARRLPQLLGVEKKELPMLQAIDPTPGELLLVRALLAHRRPVEPEEVHWASQWGIAREAAAFLPWMTLGAARRYLERQTEAGYREEARTRGDTLREAWRRTLRLRVQDWADYLEECAQLGLDRRLEEINRPRDLLLAHSRTSAQIQIRKDQEKMEGIARRAEEMAALGWEREGFLIRPIASLEELILEGKTLHHCVGSYGDKYARGGCTIFAVRRREEPQLPAWTLELSTDGRVVQLRGSRNTPPPREVQDFVDQWKKTAVEAWLGRKAQKRPA